MTDRAALVTGASSGIGLALADMLGAAGYGLSVAARRPEKLEAAAAQLRANGHQVEAIAADLTDEDDVRRVVVAHEERYGRLDVLCNNAGIGFGSPVDEIATKRLDMQLALNLRAVVLFYRECAPLLRAAGSEHRQTWVVNLSSIAGKRGQPWLSVYSATKAAVVAFTEAMNQELRADGIRSIALCPGFVDTPMSDYVKDQIPAGEMITTDDIATMVRAVLALSPACTVGEIIFERQGGPL